ncbi:MAG: hypothetical protein HYZ29_11165 [Myxococcales bacterium]|nr:hypothetical protein [Myxococcales bacterium]
MVRAAFLALGLSLVGCSDDAGAGDAEAGQCLPGEQVACACPGGASKGAQICADDGKSFGACLGCASGAGGGGGWPDGGGSGGSGATGGSSGGAGGAGGAGGGVGGSGGSGAVAGAPSGPPQAKPPAPPPDGSAVVNQVAAEHPDWLAGSCIDQGGNNQFLFEVVKRLRKLDNRWGLNWKRGKVGDLSQDVVDYHYGEGVSEGSTDVYIIDMIGGHCGTSPTAGWLDVTQATLAKNEIGRWTLAGQSL